MIDKSPVEKCHRYAVHEVVNLVPWLVFEVGRGMLLPLIAQAFSAQRGDRKSVGAVWGNRVLQSASLFPMLRTEVKIEDQKELKNKNLLLTKNRDRFRGYLRWWWC